MTENEMIAEMSKPIGAAIDATSWFLILGFINYAIEKDNMFSSVQDKEAIANTAKRLHDQVFPPKKDNSEEFADVLMLKPKKLITKPDLIL